VSCDDQHKRIRLYLDDLLDEPDYQSVRAHLESCPGCAAFTAATGSLTYRLEELGRVRVPADLCQTVLYQAKAPARAAQAVPVGVAPSGTAPTPPAWPSRRWVLALVIAGPAGVVVAGVWFQGRRPSSLPDAGAAQRDALPAPPPAAAPEAFSQERIALILREAEKAGRDPEAVLEDIRRSMKASPSAGWNDWHRHVHLSASRREAAVAAARGQGLALRFETASFLLFEGGATAVGGCLEQLEREAGAFAVFGSAPAAEAATEQLSIYLE
jgi:hypothetical protein